MKPIEYTGVIEPGSYYTGMPNADYHAAEGISKSGLDKIARSPAHYQFAEPRKPTRAMDIGTAIHAALLEPSVFAEDFMLLRDVSDRRASEYKAAAKIHGPSNTLTGPESAKIEGMQAAVYANPHARALLESDGWRELSGVVRDPETGVICRHRFDLLTSDGIAVDVKKTQDARPDAFSRSLWAYRYHVQAAFYADQYKWITGRDLQEFVFIAIEEDMPHGVRIYTVDDGSMAIAREAYRENLNRYAQCVADNHWPAYDSEPEIISLPGWVLAQYENDLEDSII